MNTGSYITHYSLLHCHIYLMKVQTKWCALFYISFGVSSLFLLALQHVVLQISTHVPTASVGGKCGGWLLPYQVVKVPNSGYSIP